MVKQKKKQDKKEKFKKAPQKKKISKQPKKKVIKNKKTINKKASKKQSYSSDSYNSSDSEKYDEETSNPISENSSQKSWTDDSQDQPKNKKIKKEIPKKASFIPNIQGSQTLTLKQQAEQKWDKKIQKWIEMTPADAIKDINDLKLELSEKLELGNELTDYVKKLQKIGQDKTKYIYTSAQLKDYNQLKEQLASNTVKALQEELVKNEQPKTDVKAAVLERVLDGRILGKIPKCPNCFGGRLRFNNENGSYLCPGYVDGGDNCVKGDDYIFCFTKYSLNDIKRETWQS